MSIQNVITPTWKYYEYAHLIGGLDTSLPSHYIEKQYTPQAINVVFRNGRVVIDSGYRRLGTDEHTGLEQFLRGDARRFFIYETSVGTTTLLCVTDKSLWRLNNAGAWELVSDSTSNTLASGITGGNLLITLTDATNFAIGDVIAVTDNDGKTQYRQITGKSVNLLSLDTALPNPFVADAGNVVYRGPRLTGTADDQVVDVPFPANGTHLFTNGKDPIQVYDGSTCEALVTTGVTLTAVKSLVVFANALVVGGITDGGTVYPSRVRWSDTGDPTVWNAGTAGFEDLVDSRDQILGMYKLAADTIIYRTRSIVRMEFRGTQLHHFFFRPTIAADSLGPSGTGAVSRNAILTLSDSHVFVSKDGIYEYTGGFEVREITPRVFRGIFDANGELDRERAHRGFIYLFDQYDDIYFFYPDVGATNHCRRALVYNISSRAFGYRQFARELSGVGPHLSSTSITYNDLVGTMAEQTWTAASSSVSGEIATVMLGGRSSNGFSYAFEYNYITPQEDSASILWELHTRDESFLDAPQRFNRFSFLMSGLSVNVDVSTDRGASFLSIVSDASPGGVPGIVRGFRDFTCEYMRLRFSGSGGGFSVEQVVAQYRPAYRW
jgi:hypothetical protein